MNRLTKLYAITKQLEDILSEDTSTQNRDAVINEVNELVEQQREKGLDHVSPPYTEE